MEPLIYYEHHYRAGRYLPESWLEAPGRPPHESEVKWVLPGFHAYCVDQWNRLWHRPTPDGLGRQRRWRQLTKAVKNNYAGFRLRKNGREYWMSVRQLRRQLVRVEAEN